MRDDVLPEQSKAGKRVHTELCTRIYSTAAAHARYRSLPNVMLHCAFHFALDDGGRHVVVPSGNVRCECDPIEMRR